MRGTHRRLKLLTMLGSAATLDLRLACNETLHVCSRWHLGEKMMGQRGNGKKMTKSKKERKRERKRANERERERKREREGGRGRERGMNEKKQNVSSSINI